MFEPKVTRRRALTIFAAAAVALGPRKKAQAETFEWRGTALGADARLILTGGNPTAARETLKVCLAEIERLEAIFSLYRPNSEISRLNRTGRLAAASLDMRRLLLLSRLIHQRSEGAFDPTVQALWRFYADWFSKHGQNSPPAEMVRARRARGGMDGIDINGSTIEMVPGTEITLNSIAQGYITDCVADLLRTLGWSYILLDLGEVRALDSRPDGSPWQIQVREGGLSIPLTDAALATSSGGSLVLSSAGDITHILDPQTGKSPHHWRSVTVCHRSAAMADALSTSLFVASPKQLARLLGRFSGTRVWATDSTGKTQVFHA